MISRRKLLAWLKRELRYYRKGYLLPEAKVRADYLEFVIGKVQRMKKKRSRR